MKTDAACTDKKKTLLIYALLIVLSFSAALLVVKNIKISPDAMRFGLISEQILSGNGIKVPIVRLEESYVPINGAVPFLDQMPLVPMIFALLGGVSTGNYLPAQILNVISHVSIALFTFLIMRRLSNNDLIALLAGSLVAWSYPLLKITHHICSETLFIAFTTASVYFLIMSRNTEDVRFSRNIMIAGICAAASIFTRNAGIALVPVFIWHCIFLKKKPGAKPGPTVFSILMPITATVIMFVRNYLISGSFRGFSQAPHNRPYLDSLTGTAAIIFEQFQLGSKSVTAILLIALVSIILVLWNSRLRNRLSRVFDSGADIIAAFIFSYTSLIFLTMATQQWQFELRYMTPLVPFLYLAVISAIVFIWRNMLPDRHQKLSALGLILSLAIFATGSSHKALLSLQEFSYKQVKAYSILQSCTYKWLKDNYPEGTIIATNRPYHLSFFGKYTTIALPHRRFNPNISVPEGMEQILPVRMSGFGSEVLALFYESSEQSEGGYITGLFNNRKSNDKFILSHQCTDGVVYKLKQFQD